jgi:hypothetical protein
MVVKVMTVSENKKKGTPERTKKANLRHYEDRIMVSFLSC